jgi:hypothetical protein
MLYINCYLHYAPTKGQMNAIAVVSHSPDDLPALRDKPQDDGISNEYFGPIRGQLLDLSQMASQTSDGVSLRKQGLGETPSDKARRSDDKKLCHGLFSEIVRLIEIGNQPGLLRLPSQ